MAKNSNIVFTKTFSSYGINIVETYSDFDLIGKELTSNPLVYYYNNFDKAIFDYSQTVNTDDLDLLDIFLQGITNGNTFSVSNGYYVKEQDGITSTINGIYQFDGATGNNIILTTVVSITGINNAEYRYENDYFVNPPKLDLNAGFTGDIAYIIKSVTNEGEITKLGLYEDDLIEISYAGNTANIDRLNVEKVEVSTDGEEFIFVKEPVVNNNRIGLWTTINVYTRGDSNTEFINKDLTINGAARVIDKNGRILACYENQNQLQGYLRKFAFSDSETSSIWGYAGNCSSAAAVNQFNIGVGLDYYTLIDVRCDGGSFLINGIPNAPLILLPNKTYAFYQGHSSNNKTSAILFSKKQTAAISSLLTNSYTQIGVPGTSEAITLLSTASTPSLFFYVNATDPKKGGSIRISNVPKSMSSSITPPPSPLY